MPVMQRNADMADTRQQYHGYEARQYGPRCRIPYQNIYYWRMNGRAWFRYLRKTSISKRIKLVFDCPMSKPIQRS